MKEGEEKKSMYSLRIYKFGTVVTKTHCVYILIALYLFLLLFNISVFLYALQSILCFEVDGEGEEEEAGEEATRNTEDRDVCALQKCNILIGCFGTSDMHRQTPRFRIHASLGRFTRTWRVRLTANRFFFIFFVLFC